MLMIYLAGPKRACHQARYVGYLHGGFRWFGSRDGGIFRCTVDLPSFAIKGRMHFHIPILDP